MGRKANGASRKTTTKPTKAQRSNKTAKLTRADEDHQRTVFFHHKNKLQRLIGQREEIAAHIKEAYQIAKGAGVSRQDIEIALKLQDDEVKVAAAFQATERVAKWMGYAIGSQLKLFADDQAFEDGKRAGSQNEMRKPPENLAREESSRWFAGYDDGLKSYNSAIANAFRGTADNKPDMAPIGAAAAGVLDKISAGARPAH